ncbi:hypothetical protein CAEBREN_25540 [Caenorhabditis brenneri]|uniref:SPK domain-containing protein n=1 Tax=Caenorhabditis brenneri TaxID=135651 RepID=G0MQY5_CAEBE|nr:hypothetical protein CAEBREN_25540 [Caenorhabditis brenneri]
MAGPSEYVGSFIDFCANKLTNNPNMELPTTKSSLSGEFINEMKVPFSRNYIISAILKPHYLLDNIRRSSYPREMQAKLLVLLSLPVDEEYFEKRVISCRALCVTEILRLNKAIKIELDEYRRIDQIECDGEVINFLHRRPQAQKRKIQCSEVVGGPEVKKTNVGAIPPLPSLEVREEPVNAAPSHHSLWENHTNMDLCQTLSWLLENPSAEYQNPIFLPRINFRNIEIITIQKSDVRSLTRRTVPPVVEPIEPVEEEDGEGDKTSSPLEVALKVLGGFRSV